VGGFEELLLEVGNDADRTHALHGWMAAHRQQSRFRLARSAAQKREVDDSDWTLPPAVLVMVMTIVQPKMTCFAR